MCLTPGGGAGGNIGANTAGTNAQTGGIIRRQSLVKLHSLTIEAPITRVFSIIAAAQDNSPAYVAQALEKAVEILRSTELYSPQLVPTVGAGGGSVGGGGDGMAGVRAMVPAADPVATDLLGGLLAVSVCMRACVCVLVKDNTTAVPRLSQSIREVATICLFYDVCILYVSIVYIPGESRLTPRGHSHPTTSFRRDLRSCTFHGKLIRILVGNPVVWLVSCGHEKKKSTSCLVE